MKKSICPITKKIFNCQSCKAVLDGEICRYSVRDSIAEGDFRFVRKVLEREMNENRTS